MNTVIFVLNLLVIIGTVYSIICEEDFLEINDDCYWFSHGFKATWAEASMYCLCMSGDLADIDTAFKEDLLSVIDKKGVLYKNVVELGELYWIGANKVINGREWRWAAKVVVVPVGADANWLDGQPVDRGGSCVLMSMFGNSSGWLNRDCNEYHSFICRQ